MEKTKKKKDWRSEKMRLLKNEIAHYKATAERLESTIKSYREGQEKARVQINELTQKNNATLGNVEMLMYAMRLIQAENRKAQMEIRSLSEKLNENFKSKVE